MRLTAKAREVDGLISDQKWDAFQEKTALLKEANEFLMSYSLSKHIWYERGIKKASPSKTDKETAHKVLSYPK